MRAAEQRQHSIDLQIPGYRIERLIAEGGMASVYMAEQESLHRQVALKVLRKFDDNEQAGRFVNEGRIIASLNHRNIITIHDIGHIGERSYLAMEYLEGGTLSRRIRAGMAPDDALELLVEIAKCLDFVHRRGIVHRDIKPSNILFHADGTPVLTDFGVAKDFGTDQSLTLDGSAVGSPYYLSPEQARSRPLDGRSDIYSLGVILFEMLTGQKPFRGESMVETVLAHLKEPIPALPEHLSIYEPVLTKMLAKRPRERYESARALVQDIGRLETSSKAPTASPVKENAGDLDATRTLSSTRPSRTRRATSPRLYAAAILAALSTLVTTAWWLNESESEAIGPPPPPERIEASDPPQASSLSALQPDDPAANADPIVTEATAPPTPVSDTAPQLEPHPTSPGTTDNVQPEPAASVPTIRQEPTDKQQARLKRLIRKGNQALQDYRLTTPKNDNARYYFRQVGKIDPGHPAARSAPHRIGQAYAKLAQSRLNRNDYKATLHFAKRGLKIDPGNKWLLALRQQARDMRHKAQVVEQVPKPASASTPVIPKVEPEQWEESDFY